MSKALDQAIRVLEVSASNIRSLGPAGALSIEPFVPYRVWLADVERALEGLKTEMRGNND